MRLGDSVSGFCTFQCRWVVSLACHSFLPQTLSNRKHWEICQSLLDSYHFKTLSSWKVSYMSSVENMLWPILSFCSLLLWLFLGLSGRLQSPAVCVSCYFLPLVIHSLLRTLSLVEQWYHSTQDPCCLQKIMVLLPVVESPLSLAEVTPGKTVRLIPPGSFLVFSIDHCSQPRPLTPLYSNTH